jgi:hypothetical protein
MGHDITSPLFLVKKQLLPFFKYLSCEEENFAEHDKELLEDDICISSTNVKGFEWTHVPPTTKCENLRQFTEAGQGHTPQKASYSIDASSTVHKKEIMMKIGRNKRN